MLVLLLALLPTLTYTQCTGDLVWKEGVSICLPTCPLHFYYADCPARTTSRCVCPDDKVLQTEDSNVCIEGTQCQATDWYKLGSDGLSQFKFQQQPIDQTVTVGKSVTIQCVVTASKPVQYYWYKMKKLPSGDMTGNDNLYLAGTTKIILSSVKVSDAGFYQCKARSQDGYSLLSSVAELKVKHTSFDSTKRSNEGSVINKAKAILTCNKASSSYPSAEIQWTKDGNRVSAGDMFMNSKAGEAEFGYLYILNVKSAHQGTYKCIATVTDSDVGGVFVLSEINFEIRGSQNAVKGAPQVLKESSYGSEVSLGDTGVLYCGAYGYPAPEYTWAKTLSNIEIQGCGESYCVEDYGRRLKVSNIKKTDFGGYFCQVKNSVSHNSQVLTLTEAPKSFDINFLGITSSTMVVPNSYASFNLTCAVDIVSSDRVYIGWYKDGESVSGGDRIQTEDILTSVSRIRKLVFKYPTDSDPGLYQCLAYNSERFVQDSTDITMYRYTEDTRVLDTALWNLQSSFQLKLFQQSKGVVSAHEACNSWMPGAELVSILSNEQNDAVFRLAQAANISKVWIGLTDEHEEGVWRWNSKENSSRYSNWKYNEPNNGGSRGSDYAVMDLATAGKWEDSDNTQSYPFVCKYYNATCTSLDTSDEFKEYTVIQYQRESSMTFHAFDTAIVQCKTGNTATITCGTDGKWIFPGAATCDAKVVNSSVSVVQSVVVLAVSLWCTVMR